MGRSLELEKISDEPREANIAPAQVGTIADQCRRIGVTEQSYYR